MVYFRFPQPMHSTVPQAAHMVCLACINALFLSAKKKKKRTSTSSSLKKQNRKEPVCVFGAVVISRSGFPLGRCSIISAVIWSYIYIHGALLQIVSVG